MQEKTFKKQTYGNFEAVGFIQGLSDDSFKKNLRGKNNPSWVYSRMNLRLVDEAGKNFFISVQDGYSEVNGKDIYVADKENNPLVIKFGDRTNAPVLAAINDNGFIQVGIKREKQTNEDGKEFMGWTYNKYLTQYDLITFLSGVLQDGMKVKISGSVKFTEYNGNINREFTIKRMFFLGADDTTPTAFKFTQNILIDEDSLDKSKFEETLTATVLGKVYQKKKKGVYEVFPVEYVIRATPENKEKVVRMMDKFFTVPTGKLRRINVEGLYNIGYIQSAMTEADLPDEALELIEMGAYTKEEILSRSANRTKVDEMEIKRPVVLRGDKPTVDMSDDEFEFADLENLEIAIEQPIIVEENENNDLSFLDDLGL